ncbi:MAG: rhodanese-like domain-containing protein [Oligoflexia bacterium]|nr:rhodanese-like domain-containing protein [Oligoflexia bacterium]
MKLSMGDLFKKLGKLGANELVLDVREPDEFRSGHVPGSRNIPLSQVAEHLDELRKYERVYIHCQRGGRAGKAADRLGQLGLKNIVCVGDSGMADWIAAGYPVER